ncbi:MAG: tRNA (adenosine(37)-N6)-dimethylallyltransferase MiaA [Myxococcales bacterium]|nr:tRNA (adenosine(37)-N6)-dimethylallyltransferase MiaA [Myxococcales bacterium]
MSDQSQPEASRDGERASDAERPPVVVLAGPTAAGKPGLSLDFAEAIGAEIVSADSMQVYRFLDIGTAKPSFAERARVPHHLIDVVNPDVPYNAARYAADARAVAAGIHGRGRPVLLVGGTGLYVRAFLEGLVEAGGADPEFRERLERGDREARARGDTGWLHRELEKRDPERARELHPNDAVRLVRAIELSERTGTTAAERARAQRAASPFRVLHLAVDPGTDVLDDRIDRRCDAMIEAGLLQEVRDLRKRGYGPELRPLQGIGYRHMHPVVEGSDTLVNAVAAMKLDTRRFARRQRTWLRALPQVRWFHPADGARILAQIEAFLAAAAEREESGG